MYELGWFEYSICHYCSWLLFADLFILDICFILLGAGFITEGIDALKAGYALLMVAAFLSCM